MIEKLSIKDFKFIRGLSIDCKKIILFPGELPSGCSSILGDFFLLNQSRYQEVVEHEKNPV